MARVFQELLVTPISSTYFGPMSNGFVQSLGFHDPVRLTLVSDMIPKSFFSGKEILTC